MYYFRLNYRKITLWIILTLQVLLITSYFFLQIETTNKMTPNLKSPITFLKPANNVISNKEIVTYHTQSSQIYLNDISSANLYIDFNTSVCYKTGSDLKAMQRSKLFNWKCDCLPGWHGNDCAQPEVIWRALLAYRKPLTLKGPGKYQRRIIYLFEVEDFSSTIADIRVHELNSTVDLFILYENELSNYLEHKLNNVLKNYHKKILYIKGATTKNIWVRAKKVIKNLRPDDIILNSKLNEIPNTAALQFFKLYENWPQPLQFRLRWSVYGFFWIHPEKTTLRGGACTISYLYETYNDDVNLLHDNKTLNLAPKKIIVGDLNHFGGWFCEYCYESEKILDYLFTKTAYNITYFKKVSKNQIDSTFLDDFIENGIYVDGKTELMRTHRSQERYYAPYYVIENENKYDWLLINLYSKMDYY